MACLQVLSDSHLDFWKEMYEFEQIAPCLVLAGDIGDVDSALYHDFLKKQADRFDKVLMVLGNSEYDKKQPHYVPGKVREVVEKMGNVMLLDRGSCDLDGDVRVLGCTLWSLIPDGPPKEVRRLLDRGIRDWGVEANNAAHARDRRWLEEEIARAEAEGKRVVIVTHHAPALDGCTEIEHLLAPPVTHYVFGHTHAACNRTLPSGCRLVACQRGLPGEPVMAPKSVYVSVYVSNVDAATEAVHRPGSTPS